MSCCDIVALDVVHFVTYSPSLLSPASDYVCQFTLVRGVIHSFIHSGMDNGFSYRSGNAGRRMDYVAGHCLSPGPSVPQTC